MREVTNPEEVAALATVPEIDRTVKLHADAKERFRKHPAGVAPDVARNAVIDDAVNSFTAEGAWPKDVGTKAAKAYADAQVWEAERLALNKAVDVTEHLADDSREMYAPDALKYLGTRLATVLEAARKDADKLGDVQSADQAITAGGDALKAWSTLQGLTTEYRNIKAAQWEFLAPVMRRGEMAGTHAERAQLRHWRGAGYGHLQGSLDDVPPDVLEALRTERYTVAALAHVARIGTGWVPQSFDDLKAEVESATAVPVWSDQGLMTRDMSPYVVEIRAPRPAAVYPHSTSPALDDSQPRPAAPKPTGTVSDADPTAWRY
ncbi:hypothetical protein [Streptomyces sp. NBC_00344]|uniref:hypothetical protein n=1 Tax=Streptomyces sp. NBC_00344 TaxID=2975720 RepID=UPI002E236373